MCNVLEKNENFSPSTEGFAKLNRGPISEQVQVDAKKDPKDAKKDNT